MKEKSRALKRLGVAGLGAVIALGTPAVGFTGFASAAAGQAAITWTTPSTGNASTLNDGTNSTVKLEVEQTAANTTGNPPLTAVRFDYTQTVDAQGNDIPLASQNEVAIQTVSTAPYHLEWTPPSNGDYTLTAEPLTTGGGSAGDVIKENVTVDNTTPSVHITSPTDGSTIPFFNTAGHNWISVSGTRSKDATNGVPDVVVNASLYDQTTGFNHVGTNTSTDLDNAVAGPATDASQNWSATVEVPTGCPVGDTCQVVLDAVAMYGTDNGTTGSDESVIVNLAAASQTLATFSVTPTGTQTITDSNSGTAADQTSETYTVTATDQNGKPIAGLVVTASSAVGANPSHAVINGGTAGDGAVAVTGPDGTATFKVSDGTDETVTLTFQSEVNGTSFDAQHDFKVTRTLNVVAHVTRTLSTVTLSKTPDQPAYASQSYNQNYPVVLACLGDQFSQGFHDSSSLIVTDQRTETGVNNGAPTTVGGHLGTETNDNQDNPTGCFPVVLTSYPGGENTGSDQITVYQENNGVPGFQAGTTDKGDQITVNFAPGDISFDRYTNCTEGSDSSENCITQAQIGTVKTITVKETVGGSPVAGATLHLSIGGSASFPQSQPNGTTVTVGDNQSATCTTAADGTCQVNVSDATVEDQTLSATDGQGLTGNIYVEFRSEPLTLGSADRRDNFTLYPTGTTPGTGGTTTEDYGTPGTIMVDDYHLFDKPDANGNRHILSDIPVTVHIDHGYFTPMPTDTSDYNTGTFTPTPAAGGLAGTPKDIGTSDGHGGETLDLVTNGFGIIKFATSIGRDAGFDDDGQVLTDVTITNNGNSVDAGNPAGGTQTDRDYTWTTNSDDVVGFGSVDETQCNEQIGNGDCWIFGFDTTCNTDGGTVQGNECVFGDSGEILAGVVPGGALNGTSVTILPATGDTLTGNHTGTPFNECTDSTGNQNGCTGPATEFFVELKDQFGNLVGDNTTVSDTANETDCDGNGNSLYSSYTNSPNLCQVYSDNAPTVATPDTVTDTWNTQTTTWTANTATPGQGVPAFVATVNTTGVTKTDSFTINLYSVDLTHLNFKFNAVPGDVVKTGTTVHDEVTVTDQYNNSVQGLFVTFDQSGPGAGVDTRSDDFTDANGTASDNFSSSIQGNAQVTADVYKNCFQFTGNEGDNCTGTTGGVPLDEQVNTIGFDGVPTINVTPVSKAGKHNVAVFGTTRPGASVQLEVKQGAGSFVMVGSPQTADVNGDYSFTGPISKTTSFEVVVDTIQPSAVRTAYVKSTVVHQHPTVSLTAMQGHNAGKVRVYVKTHPNDAGAIVRIYRVRHGHTTRIRTSRIGHGGGNAHVFNFGLHVRVNIFATVAAHGNQTSGRTAKRTVVTPRKK